MALNKTICMNKLMKVLDTLLYLPWLLIGSPRIRTPQSPPTNDINKQGASLHYQVYLP